MTDTATRLNVVACTGSPFDIGQDHGSQCADLIQMGFANWAAEVEKTQGSIADYLTRFLAETDYLPTIERYAPELLEELRGISIGSGLAFEKVLAYNLMDEEWSYRVGRMDGPFPGCTAIAIRGQAIAQTMDIPTAHDGTQIVLAIEPTNGSAKRVFTGAGMLGLNGANADGVGVVVNNLAQLPSSRTGLPVIFMLRRILDNPTSAEAATWVESVPHAIGQHYLIGDPTEVISLEGAANGVFRVEVQDAYVHANHPLANLETREGTERIEAGSNTHARSSRARELAKAARNQGDVERVLEDREAPISCERKTDFMTFGGTSIGLTVPPTMRVAPGPPHETAWVDVSWS